MRLAQKSWLQRLAAGTGTAAILLSAGNSWGQAVPPRPVGDAVKGVREAAQETRQGARQAAQETRQDAREAVRDTRAEAQVDARSNARDFTGTRAADLGLWLGAGGGASGLTVFDVAPDGPISHAGFREGDRIVSINGQPVSSEPQFIQSLLVPNALDQQASIIVLRNGRQETLRFQPSALVRGMVTFDPYYQYGMLIDDRNPNRIVVQRVFPRTPAFYAGLRAGDVITGFNGAAGSVVDLTQALQTGNGNLALQISRGNLNRNLTLEANEQIRTALRPNFNAATRLDGTVQGTNQVAPGTVPGANQLTPGTVPGDNPSIGLPGRPATRAVPEGTPTRPLAPSSPIPQLPGNPRPGQNLTPSPTTVPGTTIPGTTVPGATTPGSTPTVPGTTPTTPAAPATGTGGTAVPGTSAPGGTGTSGSGT